jgi:hypothetical protein
MRTVIPLEEDPMVNQFQEYIAVTDVASKATHTMRLGYVQAAVGLALLFIISAFGLFIASQATGQESMTRKTAQATTANVLPPLFISPESQEANLNWMPATGDGGAMIEPQETAGSLPRTSPRAR